MNDTTHLISLSEKATALEAQMVFKNLDFYYGKFHALKAIDLEIYKRHVTAFIGLSLIHILHVEIHQGSSGIDGGSFSINGRSRG